MARQPAHPGAVRCCPILAALLLTAAIAATLVVATPPATARARPAAARLAQICPPGAQLRGSQPYTPPAQFAHVIHVAADEPSIQAGVNAARPGDLVLVAPGVYHENVVVCTHDLTIRGEDRNRTILDGGGLARRSNGVTVLADNVIVENLTAHHFDGNGFMWAYVSGFRGSYLTAYDNGDYNIYAYGSRRGEFDHSYASGAPDSGFYIGQCWPCDALITDIHSQYNGLGYSGTNAGGNLILEHSEWDHNGSGIVPNTLDGETGPPERGTTIVGNYIHDNGNVTVPSTRLSFAGQGFGIGVPGGDLNYIANNRVENSSAYGILVLASSDQNFWLASGNVVEHNRITGSGIADLALGVPSGANNCFSDNQAATTLPPLLELTHPCGSSLALNGGGDLSISLRMLAQLTSADGPSFHALDYRTFKAPPPQQTMPGVNAPPASLFTEPFSTDDTGNHPYPPQVTGGGTAMLAPLGFTGYTIVQVLLALYGNLLLVALYAAWLAVAFVELSQREDLPTGRRFGWGAVTLAVPILGPIAYYFAGGSKLSRGFRLALVVGAPLLCLALAALLMVIASFTL